MKYYNMKISIVDSIVDKAKQIWIENELEECFTPIYSNPYDPWGYNVGGTLRTETVSYDGFEFTKRGNTVSFIDPNGETGEFNVS